MFDKVVNITPTPTFNSIQKVYFPTKYCNVYFYADDIILHYIHFAANETWMTSTPFIINSRVIPLT